MTSAALGGINDDAALVKPNTDPVVRPLNRQLRFGAYLNAGSVGKLEDPSGCKTVHHLPSLNLISDWQRFCGAIRETGQLSARCLCDTGRSIGPKRVPNDKS